MDKKDWKFLIWISVISIPIAWLVKYLNDQSTTTTSFWLSLVGTILTLIGLTFTIYQQFKIKRTSEQIRNNSDTIYNNIKKELNSFHYTKAISLTNEIEDKLRSLEYPVALALIKQLQETLTECRKIYTIDFSKQLDKCCECIDNQKGKSFAQIVQECKDKCEAESNETIKKINKKISNHYIRLHSQISSNNANFATEPLVKDVLILRNTLNTVRTSPLNIFN
ncbi:hypothetical protein [Flavobacterium sp.]|uniref:hypothetical protein n=1 Tax=Flavobacterium sp. TaxID=239 RepID=UPI00374CFFAD